MTTNNFFVNSTGLFILVVGIDIASAIGAGSNVKISVQNSNLKTVSSLDLAQVTAVGVAYEFPVHLLIPPGGRLLFSFGGAVFNFQAVMGTLVELKGFI